MCSDVVDSAYKTLFDGSPEAMLLCNTDGTILAANPAASSMFLRANEDLFNGGRDSLFSERDRVLFEKFLDESSLAEKATGELLLVRGDGSHFMAEVSATLHRTDDARVLTMFVIRDISERTQKEQLLSETEARWRFAIEGAGDGVFDWNIPAGELRFSRRWKEMLGFAENEIGSGLEEWTSRIHLEDLPHVMRAVQAHLDGSSAGYTSEHRLRCKDGGWKWILARGLVIEREAGGAAVRLFATHEDITEHKLAHIELLRSKQALDEAQRLAHLGSWEMDNESEVVTWSDELYRIYGLDPASGPRPFPEYKAMFTPHSWARLDAAVKRAVATGEPYEIELEIVRGDGSHGWVWARGEEVLNAEAARVGLRGVVLDITERKRAEAAVRRLSNYDALTGLPNRKRFMQLLETAVRKHCEHALFGGLLIVNLDGFRTLNDSFGREAGDALLVEVSTRLQQSVNAGDLVSRFGSDEFVLLLNNVGRSLEQASVALLAIAQTILVRLEDSYVLDEARYHSTCSAGATLFGNNGVSGQELISQLGIALSEAKQNGGNRVRFFDPEWQQLVGESVQLLNDLRDGIARHELEMLFQPQLDQVGNIVGAEALVRWNHPHRGLLGPADFIPVAEEHGLMVQLGDEIMHLCLAQLQRWQNEPGSRRLKLSINITAEQFYSDAFADWFEGLIARYHLDASGVMLEFTESMLLGDLELARANIDRLSARGISFAIDDFGTGYSSLSYLSQLPMKQLKIDKSFVSNIGIRHRDTAIVRAIIDMAKALEMEVVAEGVETEDQRQYLLQHGCSYYQGYLFSRPLPLAEFNALMARGPIIEPMRR